MATIKEDYISFEIAELLREKGFNAKCNYIWILDKANNPEDTDGVYKVSSPRFMEGESYVSNEDIDKVLEYSDDYYNKYVFLCPTIQMTIKWLREVYRINIEVFYFTSNSDSWAWAFEIIKLPSGATVYGEYDKKNYEQACEAAIRYCLEHLI